MLELFQAAISPINLTYTILLGLVLIYWLTVIIGVLDMDVFDFDVDVDVDVDVDIDVDVDVDADVSSSVTSLGFVKGTLSFFNFGKVPFMVVFSIVVLAAWVTSILLNHYFGQGSGVFALLIALPNIIFSLFVGKLVTMPLIPLFKLLDGEEDELEIVGQICSIVITADHLKLGQAKILHNDNEILVTVKMAEEGELKKGEEAIIIDQSADEKYYLIEKHHSI